ncbi:uncharacterized protein B0T23DRAFT_199502 [Neurospora hispaniola]|uniref:Uncharacterized protein n=1 Tax=Neurospora hispaniola TaxID=588809 RepID=A0AAJ0MPR3_9PEZI|nr:hypothetical protein B0T23DRAFT_199502 [Neurospora hispaniola]
MTFHQAPQHKSKPCSLLSLSFSPRARERVIFHYQSFQLAARSLWCTLVGCVAWLRIFRERLGFVGFLAYTGVGFWTGIGRLVTWVWGCWLAFFCSECIAWLLYLAYP